MSFWDKIFFEELIYNGIYKVPLAFGHFLTNFYPPTNFRKELNLKNHKHI